MRDLGLQGVRRGSKVFTTVSDKTASRAPDLVERNFTATAPNELWGTDFTYCRTWAGFVYVAFIVDVFAQLIVSWHAATRKTVDLVEVPLRIAIWERKRQGRPIEPAGSSSTPTPGHKGNTQRFTTPNRLLWREFGHPSAPSATRMTTR
jgi:transposase InsO family protein